MISLPKGGNPAERNPNVGPIGKTQVAVKLCVERQVWVQEIAVLVQETASVAYGWVGAVMEAKPPNAFFLLISLFSGSGSGSRCWLVVVKGDRKGEREWRVRR